MSARNRRFNPARVQRRVARRMSREGFLNGLLLRPSPSQDDMRVRLDRLQFEERNRERDRCTHPDGWYDAPARVWLWCPDCRDYFEVSS